LGDPNQEEGWCNSFERFRKITKSAKAQNHKPPKLLHTDEGTEFENKHFKSLVDTFKTHMCHTQNLEKSSIIEELNRTLNIKLKIQFEVRNNKKSGSMSYGTYWTNTTLKTNTDLSE